MKALQKQLKSITIFGFPLPFSVGVHLYSDTESEAEMIERLSR